MTCILICLFPPAATLDEVYAFHYKSASFQAGLPARWDPFDLTADYARMGVPNGNWCSTSINKNYEVILAQLKTPVCLEVDYVLEVTHIASWAYYTGELPWLVGKALRSLHVFISCLDFRQPP